MEDKFTSNGNNSGGGVSLDKSNRCSTKTANSQAKSAKDTLNTSFADKFMRCLFTLILVTSFIPNAAYAKSSTINNADTTSANTTLQADSSTQDQTQIQETSYLSDQDATENELTLASSSQDKNTDSSEATLAADYTEKTGEVGRCIVGNESDGVYAILVDPSTASETGDPYLLFEPVAGENGVGTLRRTETNDDYEQMFHATSPGPAKYKDYLTKITSIKSNGTINCADSMRSLFLDFSVLSDISDLATWNISDVTDIKGLFSGCKNLSDISPLQNWNTSKVTNLDGTFYYCSISDLSPLQSWDTSQVTNLSKTFQFCTNITDLDKLSNWKTSNVTNMYYTFCACLGLTDISGISSWETNNVTNMYGTFNDCESLTNLNGLQTNGNCWNTSKVTNMNTTFNYCKKLTDISAISNWDTSSVTDMAVIFDECRSLSDLTPLANWKTSKVTTMQISFSCCEKITNLDALAKWDTSSVTNMSSMFSECENLTDISGIGSWSTASVTNMKNMFDKCSNLEKADLSYLNDCNASITYPSQYIAATKSYSLTEFTLPNSLDKFLDSTATYANNPFDVSYISSMTPADAGYCYVYEYTGDDGNTQQIREATDTATYAKFMELWNAGSLLSKTMVVKQVPITYTVTFDTNGASGSVPSDITATYGAESSTDSGYQTYPDAPADLTNGGLEFIGWYNSADTSTSPTVYKAGEAIVNLASTQGATVTLYPKWGSTATTDDTGIVTIDGIQFSVTYDNDDDPDMESPLEGAKFTVITEGSEYKLELPAAADGRNVKVVAVSAQDTSVAKSGIKIATTENSGTDRGSKSTNSQGTAEFRVKYNITYNLDDGANPDSNASTYEYGVGLTLANASKDNYKFDGWYTNYTLSDASKITAISNTQKGDVVLYAKFSADTVTITYDSNGGTLPVGTSTTIDIARGGVITGGLPQATKQGYTLEGWYYTDNTLPTPQKIKATDITAYSKNTTLTAEWTANTNTKYTIKYLTQNLDGTTYSLVDEVTKTDGTTGATTSAAAEKAFEGFSSPATDDIEQQEILGDGSTVVEIKYTRNTYILNYNSNGKDAINMPNPLSSEVKYGAVINNQTTPSIYGYIFGGWFKDAGQIEWNFETNTMPASTLDLYAKWTPISYKVVFGANGASGTGPEHMDLTYDTLDQKFPDAGSFKKDGYEFAGWVLLDETGAETTTTYAAGDAISTPLTSTEGDIVNFNAIWTAVEKDSTDTKGETEVTDGKNVYYVTVTYDDDDDPTTSQEALEGATIEIVKGETDEDPTSIKVTLPDCSTGRDVTVRVKDSNGDVSDMSVHAIEADNTTDRGTKDTDAKGKAFFKGRYEGTTDADGKITITDPSNSNKELYFYVTYDNNDDMTDAEGPLEGAVITAYKSGEVSVVLPDDATTKAVSVYVWNDDGAVVDKTMTATEAGGKDRGTPVISTTDDNRGLYVFAINNQGTTGEDGTTTITDPVTGKELTVTVTYDDDGDNDAVTVEVLLKDAVVTANGDGTISVALPEVAFGRNITVSVIDGDNLPVSDKTISLYDSTEVDASKLRETKPTDEQGIAKFTGTNQCKTDETGTGEAVDPKTGEKIIFTVTCDDDADRTTGTNGCELKLSDVKITIDATDGENQGNFSIIIPQSAAGKAINVKAEKEDGTLICDRTLSAAEEDGTIRTSVKVLDDETYYIAGTNEGTTDDKGRTEVVDPSDNKTIKATVTYDDDDDPSTPETPVKGAEITVNPDGSIDVVLPDEVGDRNVTVTIEDEDDNPIADKVVNIEDKEATRQESDTTDADGQAKFVTTYSIRYELLGGTNSENNPKSYKKGVGVESFENAIRSGYVFSGWYTSDLATKITKIDSTTTGDVVLYANWIPLQEGQIAITFDPNGATETPDAQVITVGSTLLSIPEVTKAGYKFDGWMNGNSLVTDQTTFTTSTKIKAAFTEQDTDYKVEHYTINYDGAVNTTPTVETLKGKTDSLTNAQPKEDILSKGYSVLPYTQQTIKGDGSTVVRIYYKLNTCVVEFDGNGVYADTEVQTVPYGGKVEEPQEPEADGKVFEGWYADSGCTDGNEWDFDQDTVSTPSLKLYAKWTSTEPTDQPWQRLWGEDRYGTNSAIVEEGFDQTGGTVILASGENFPDALSASALAGAENAPVLLTPTNSLSDETAKQLDRLAPSKVYIMGQYSAVSADVEQAVEAKLPNAEISRIGGPTRIETAIEIYKEGAKEDVWADTAIVTSSQKFADALSVSPVAWANKYPIFLTDGQSLTLTDEAVSSIKEGGFERVLLLGGDTCVSDEVKDQLSGLEFVRLAGDLRYDTSIEIAKWAHENTGATYNTMLVAYGENFPDALSGSALAGKRNTVMVLASDSEKGLLAADTIVKSNASQIGWGSFLGGEKVISQSVARTYEDASKN